MNDKMTIDENSIDESAIKEEKKALRKKIRAKFEQQDNLEIVRSAHSLQEDISYCKGFLDRISSYKNAKTVFGYLSMDVEFPTVRLLKQIIEDGKTLALPRVHGKLLQFCQMQLEGEKLSSLEKGSFGIMEPAQDTPILFPQTKEKLQELLPLVVLVPGRAFSPTGERLGYGGGFYDRFFSSLFSSCERFSVSLVGLCFSFQMFQHLPLGKYDMLVNEVFTEKMDNICV